MSLLTASFISRYTSKVHQKSAVLEELLGISSKALNVIEKMFMHCYEECFIYMISFFSETEYCCASASGKE